MAALEIAGIDLVAKNADKAIRDVQRMDKAVAALTKTAIKSGKETTTADKAIEKAAKDAEKAAVKMAKEVEKANKAAAKSAQDLASKQSNAKQKLVDFARDAGGNLGNKISSVATKVSGLTSAIGALGITSGVVMTGGVLALIGGLGLLAYAIVKIGARGAYLDQTAAAFSRMTSGIGSSDEVLAKLRTQVRGTVTDMELMRLTTLGVQGTSEAFRTEVLPNFGKILDVTSRVAQATGQSADIIREKFLLGLRRQSKLLLDDVGVAVNAEAAYAKYAKTIGKSASALTEMEKQAAFAREAISQLDRIGSEVGGAGGTVENINRFRVAIQNVKDMIARAFAPAAGAAFKILADIASKIEDAFRTVMPLIRNVTELISNVFIIAWQSASEVIETFWNLSAPARRALQWIAALAKIAADGVLELGKVLKDISPFKAFGKNAAAGFEGGAKTIDNFILKGAEKLAYGGAFMIGAFAKGILTGGALVLKAVNTIAGLVADFLEGLSPPKKGPLSHIDKGGENVAKAWAEGFMGGVIQPVADVAAYVDGQLGAIGNFSREQVATRLGELDLAVRPFVEQLDLAKAKLQEMAGILDPATKILERQRTTALKAFGLGKGGDVEGLRNFDRQLATIRDINEERQNAVDFADLQLGIARSTQEYERALLLIQQRRLGEAEKGIKDINDAKAAGAGEAPIEDELGLGLVIPEDTGDSIADRLKSALSKGLGEGLGASDFDSALQAFLGQTGDFTNNISRIAGAVPDVGSNLVSGITSLPAKLLSPLDTLKNSFKTPFDLLFGGEGFGEIGTTITNGLLGTVQSLPAKMLETLLIAKNSIKAPFNSLFGGDGFGEIGNIFNGFFGEDGFVRGQMSSFNDWIDNVFGISIYDTFKGLFGIGGLVRGIMIDDFGGLFGENGVIVILVKAAFNSVIIAIESMLNSVLSTLRAPIEILNNSPALGKAIPDEALDAFANISIPRLAKGGLNVKGIYLAGEKGAELIASNNSTVFPFEATRALMKLSAMPISAPLSGNSVTNNTTYNNNYNSTYNVPSANSAIVMQRQMYAMGR